MKPNAELPRLSAVCAARRREAFRTSEEQSVTPRVIYRGLVLEVGAARSPGRGPLAKIVGWPVLE